MDPVQQEAFTEAVQSSGVQNSGISETSSGLLVGVEPSQASQMQQTQPETPETPNAAEEARMARFTEEDITRARQQEKDKLYPQMESLRETVSKLEKEREERLAEEQRLQEEAEARAKEEAESGMDVRQLLEQKEREWAEKLRKEQEERENAFALLERERAFQELQEHRQARLESARDEIIPELLDLVTGNTPEEIDASIESLRERSARILESAQSAMQNTRRELVGSRVTAPSTGGPMDTQQEQQQFTPDSIRNMSMNDYAKHRSRLLGANTKSRGMFG